MEISIANADVGEEIEATTIVAVSVWRKGFITCWNYQKPFNLLCIVYIGSISYDWNLVYDDYL